MSQQTMFEEYTPASAPAGSRRALERIERSLGFVPAAAARLAGSPELLDGFQRLSGMFEQSTLDPLARETVIMTVAVRNDCQVCVAMHTAKLAALGAPQATVDAMCGQRPLDDERLEAVRRFTLAVLTSAGAVSDADLSDFLAHGHTRRNALEVVLGIGTYTMSTFANRLVRAPANERRDPAQTA
ncbi:carboxymuconolactone decarboxylase family protein [Streptomyces sp. B-S-A8]|uniref:Carboxymuconolactone decarboxylase family protein n=1 Tax=Streptomyces solicavernae TaxID=3043614 RepID=A0ABT6RQB6_9ACTN|nr:carboxymuconolactone decarboxylase family protein [Streptomyces sp. B-S-A8]MDI3385943.1 carboxymuconolactone decarboxylase family protein [Streptomyces sp. B-S-A8]